MRVTVVPVVLAILMGSRPGAASGQTSKLNEVTFVNPTGEAALVRVFLPASGGRSRAKVGELEVPDGGSGSLKLPDGTFYHVVKFRTHGKPRYSKAAPFVLDPPPDATVKARITLHKVLGGNLASEEVDGSEFEEPPSLPAKVPTGH